MKSLTVQIVSLFIESEHIVKMNSDTPQISVNPERMPCPLNEFSEHCTADMPTMDSAWHYWMQDKYEDARKWWDEQRKHNSLKGAT